MLGDGRRAAIVGIGETEFSRDIGRSERRIAVEVVKAALDDAGIAPADVDGVVSMTLESTDETELARNLGFGDLSFFAQVAGGGGAGAGMVGLAAMAVGARQAETVVVFRARNRSSGGRPWQQGRYMHEGQPWQVPYGMARPVDEIAAWSRRWLYERGIRREQLGAVALAFRAHAQRNPKAQMYGRPMSLDDYLAGRWISEPLCLFDCCLETDGAVALVVTTAERARDLWRPVVIVHAFAQGVSRQYQPMLNAWADDPLRGPADAAAAKLWSLAEVGPADVDVAQIYDAFSPLVLSTLEAYGFCERGSSGEFAASGELCWPRGRLPTNTSGGGLSEAYIHGMNLLTEAVRQLRGSSSAQVERAEVCFVSSAACAQTSSMILTR